MKPRATPVSPLKAKPLRQPGQSLDEEMLHVVGEELLPLFGLAVALCLLAWMEWWQWYFNLPPQPVLLTVMAGGALVGTGYKCVVTRRRLQRLKRARDGERAVGQYLEALREKGYRVLHDLIGEGFNVDHVRIGPAGGFTVETNTIRPPANDLIRGRRHEDAPPPGWGIAEFLTKLPAVFRGWNYGI